MKISFIFLILLSINLVACLGEEASETSESLETQNPINAQQAGSATEGCEKPLASYVKFQQVFNDCNSWAEDKSTLEVKYRSDDATLTGLGIRVHFDSSALSFEKFSYNFPTEFIGSSGPDNDVDDYDDNPSTDKYVSANWASLLGNWPGEDHTFELTGLTEISLVNIDFNVIDNTTENYIINYTSSSHASGLNLILGK